MKNKIITLFAILLLGIGLLGGCKNSATATDNSEDNKISVVCTIFPQYDWVREIIGEQSKDYDLTLLLDDGIDLHNYQPTAFDIAKIVDCDLFIYVGGESDAWVEDALKEVTNKNMIVINLLDVLGNDVKEEELIEGMESEEEEAEESAEEPEYDEHVWLSLKNAMTISSKIAEALETLDKENVKIYKENCNNYITELNALNDEYQATVDSAARKTVLFGDRFPFRYMVEDYGLNYYAAFVGCSAETEASFETIIFLADKVDELGIPTVLVIEGSDQKIAKTITENTTDGNQKIMVMNSLQSVTSKDIENGFTYLDAMQENLITLKDALN